MSFYAKSVSFWPNACRANFGVKWRVFFSTSIFVQKCQFWEIKNWISWEMLIFSNKWTSYWKTCLFSENCDFLCDCLHTSRNCRILIKTLIFLRKCLFAHVLIFIKVFYLLKNCYFDSKYHFIPVIFWIKVSFLGKIYISDGINLWTNWAIFWEWC